MSAQLSTQLSSPTIPRRHDLDALRAIAMLLGIALHAALAYMPLPAGGWPVQDTHQNDAFALFMAAVHGFRMPLFFLISGFFTAMLWRKRGLHALLMHRSKRIFLPLAIGMFTIIPAVWIAVIGTSVRSQTLAVGAPASIWMAAREGDLEILQERLIGGADPDDLEPNSGATPLSIAAERGHDEVIELLIANGADVTARNRDGATPLHEAVLFGHTESVRALLDQGADVSAKNRLGETAADMLSVDGMRLLVVAGLGGIEVDPSTDKSEIASMLGSADPFAKSQSEPLGSKATEEASTGSGDGIPRGLVMLLLTLFPLFHHLWFLWFLCWLVAFFAIYAKLVTRLKWKPPEWMVISPLRYAWLIPLTILPQSMMGLLYPNFGPDTSTGILPMPQILLYYAIFFFYGAMYFDCDDVAGRVGRWWRVTLPVALLVVFPIGYELTTGGLGFTDKTWIDSGWCRPLSVVLQVVYVWLMTFGLIGLFRSCFASESKTMRYISDSAYWLYVAHLPLIMVVQSVVQSWQIPALAKLAVVCTVTSALLLASYQWCVRYTPIGTLLNGPRTRPAKVVAAMVVEPKSTPS